MDRTLNLLGTPSTRAQYFLVSTPRRFYRRAGRSEDEMRQGNLEYSRSGDFHPETCTCGKCMRARAEGLRYCPKCDGGFASYEWARNEHNHHVVKHPRSEGPSSMSKDNVGSPEDGARAGDYILSKMTFGDKDPWSKTASAYILGGGFWLGIIGFSIAVSLGWWGLTWDGVKDFISDIYALALLVSVVSVAVVGAWIFVWGRLRSE